jgi:hypothetical protein
MFIVLNSRNKEFSINADNIVCISLIENSQNNIKISLSDSNSILIYDDYDRIVRKFLSIKGFEMVKNQGKQILVNVNNITYVYPFDNVKFVGPTSNKLDNDITKIYFVNNESIIIDELYEDVKKKLDFN